MATWLRQSTAAEIAIGPFLDSADGNTVESALTITQPDIRIKKDGAAWVQKNAAQTLTHEENGWYEIALDATDTNTLGLLIVAVHESGALPVWREFMVVPAQVWDSLFSTDLLQVDLTQWLGATPSALNSGNVPASTNTLASSAITDTTLAAGTGLRPVRTGTAQGGASNEITLDSGASSVNDFYKGTRIYLVQSTGAGQSRLCIAYNGTTKVATVEPAWATNPVNGTVFAIRDDASTLGVAAGGIASTSFAAGAINAAAIAAGAIDDDAVAADMDAYHAKVWVIREGTTADHYAVIFFKNGQPVTAGITSPTIQVIKASDGTDLIAATALTEVGSLGIYRKDEATNKMTGGAIYFAKVTATIDGSSRQWLQQIGRDSA